MAAATEKKSPPAEKKNAEAARSLIPPEERFWKRYSPHSEAPLSVAGSFAVHALAIGGLVLFAVYLGTLFFGSGRSVPVEPVRLVIEGGGGGKVGATGTGKGVGTGAEDTGTEKDGDPDGKEEVPKTPALSKVEMTKVTDQYKPEDARYINDNPTEGARAFARLNDNLRRKLADGINPGGGQGGSGEGGGKGTGTGTGEGPGKGAGKATLSKREKRMLRWTMRFTASNGPEYVSQLQGLGAILAIPVVENPEPQFKLVKDLSKRPAALVDEDVSKIQRIYWIDDKPRSVNDVMGALGLPLRPSRFVAFMPEKLEEKLFKIEQDEMRGKHGFYDEERIFETVFRVVRGAGGYDVQLVSLKLK